jgi:hypothetical protein
VAWLHRDDDGERAEQNGNTDESLFEHGTPP